MTTDTRFYISDGNTKVGDIPTWSLPSRKTCPYATKLCSKLCYARKAENCYPQVLPSRSRNWAFSRSENFVAAVVYHTRQLGVTFFRIHESGDFYSKEYFQAWVQIAQALPEVKFLAFTKDWSLAKAKLPSNFTLVFSVWEDSPKPWPKGPKAFAGNVPNRGDCLECPGKCDSCGMCWDLPKVKRNVHFNIH